MYLFFGLIKNAYNNITYQALLLQMGPPTSLKNIFKNRIPVHIKKEFILIHLKLTKMN